MKQYIFIITMLMPVILSAQTISGTVSNTDGEPLVGANLYWLGENVGVITDGSGQFEISAEKIEDKTLVASYVGYKADTVDVGKEKFARFTLRKKGSLKEVTVTGQKPGVVLSTTEPMKTLRITGKELQKAACCDLAGCFDTQISVQPKTTNVVTNTKELSLLGLSGIYNQVLIDDLPMIRGASYTYGISSFPGTLVDNIFIAKGSNSVLQGYNSISGQINVKTLPPAESDQLLVNVFMNSFLEKQFNANYAFQQGEWSNLTAVHTTQPANKIDQNNDNFLDLPQLTRYMLFNKWQYGNPSEWGWYSKVGLRFVNEERVGGQMSFDPLSDIGSSEVYGQAVNFTQPEAWMKTGYRLNNTHHVKLYASGCHHDQNSFFGTTQYDAQQTSFYSKFQYSFNYKNHGLKAGLSYRHFDLAEEVAFTDTVLQRTYDGSYRKIENIPGIFAENTMRFFEDKLTWVAGVRADHHNEFGLMATPRTLLKYNITPQTTARANFGTGWRTANIFTENVNLLASSRDVIFTEELKPEKSLNYGANVTQKFSTMSNILTGYVSADYYRTNFQNQIFPNYDDDPTEAIIENHTGRSVSNDIQANLYLQIWQRFELSAGYTYSDVFRDIDGATRRLPFIPEHYVLTSLSYKPLTDKFHIDLNFHWHGEQRLPDTKGSPTDYQRPQFSETHTLVNAQVTYNFKRFEVYAGCENIFGYRQQYPIRGWQDPFSPYFDTSFSWGPTKGREVYAGVRFRLKGGGS